MDVERRKRTARIEVRLFAEEKEALEARAISAGVSASDLLRLAVNPQQQIKAGLTPEERTILRKLNGQIGKIGSNINQLTRLANSGIIPHMAALEQELAALKELRIQVRSVLGRKSALGRGAGEQGAGGNDG